MPGTAKMSAKLKRPPSMPNTPESNTPNASCPKPLDEPGCMLYYSDATSSLLRLSVDQLTELLSIVEHKTLASNSLSML